MLLDHDACYAALERRDRRFDGRFVTGVLTTGIYCRPSCPARTPKRGNVRFFACAAAAEEAGLRACRRCRPEIAPTAPDWELDSDLARRAVRLIDDGVVDRDGVRGLAQRLHVSERHLGRVLQRALGASPIALARARRVRVARSLVDATDVPLSAVAFAAGFGSIRRFNDEMRRAFACAPSALRRPQTRVGAGTAAEPGGAGGPAGPPVVLRVAARRPFDGASLLAFLAARAVPGVEEVDGTTYRRALAGGVVEVELVPDGATMRLLGVHLRDVPAAVVAVRRLLDLDADPMAPARALGDDPIVGPLLRRRPGLRVPGAVDGFELTVRAVLGQQVTVAGARTLLGRLVAAAGPPLPVPDAGVRRSFPGAAAVAELSQDEARALGLTGRRAATLRSLAAAVRDGAVDLSLGADVARTVADLQRIPGIGPWTAGYVALRALRDPDAWPSGDLGLRHAVERATGHAVHAAALDRVAAAWRPWRAIAALHLWTSLPEPHAPPAGARPRQRSPRSPTSVPDVRPGALRGSARTTRTARADPSSAPDTYDDALPGRRA